MTLPVAPSSISMNEISLELFSAIQTYNLNDSAGRAMVNLPTVNSTISLSNFYGKTAPLTTIGTCCYGGWYMGCTTACGQTYYLIASPATPGYIYDYYRSTSPTCLINVAASLPVFSPPVGPIGCNPVAQYDGYCLTKFIAACPGYNPCVPCGTTAGPFSYPIFNQANLLNINTYSDWYIPAANELNTLYCNMDLAWKCGGQMKATGNQFPTQNINCGLYTAPNAAAPGQWPYIGYTSFAAPGICTYGLGWNCGNPWVAMGSPQGQLYPVCLQACAINITSTQASGVPTGNLPTDCRTLYQNFSFRFYCTGGYPAPQTGTITWPAPAFWSGVFRCSINGTRAVRRVLKTL